MAIKKDTETIISKISTQESLFFSLCWEIVLAIGAVMVDRFFDVDTIKPFVCIICIVLAILPPIIIISVKFAKWIISLIRVIRGNCDVKEYVDMYDNQICYWAMIGYSYSQLLPSGSSKLSNEQLFIYQESCYYVNKCKRHLQMMYPVMNRVFVKEAEKAVKSGKVALYRLDGLLDLLDQCDQNLKLCIIGEKNNKIIEEQKSVNEHFNTLFSEFKKKQKRLWL